MKKALATALLLGFSGSALALPATYEFEADYAGGVTSATLNFEDVGGDLKITFDNTSSAFLNDMSLGNAPVITGLGMNLTPGDLSLDGWTFTSDGGTDLSTMWDISYDAGTGNLIFDLYAATTNGSQGGIYNTAAESDYASAGKDMADYLSANAVGDLAYLTLSFVDASGAAASVSDVSTAFLRVQNVGTDGEGSLKLFGETGCKAPCGGGFQEIPEPESLALMGLGLIGMIAARRRVRAK